MTKFSKSCNYLISNIEIKGSQTNISTHFAQIKEVCNYSVSNRGVESDFWKSD